VVSARVHRRRPVTVATAAAPTPAPEPAPGVAAPPVAEQGAVEVPAPGPGATSAPTDQAAGAGDGVGAGAGNGLGDGVGDGFGPGAGGPAMGRELHARVLGNEVVDVRPREGAPTISHDEATALRTRDSFPRLPESVWPGWRPYIVKLEICVGDDGRVREAVLRSSASPRLDPLVLAAAQTWQYRPRLVDGKPAPFCHGVVIKYERW
jgi:TonB family protein